MKKIYISSVNGGWWSTRLHLLAGLLADYTGVEKLVFGQQGKHLGTCGPLETRRALAAAFPAIEKAFAASLPEHRAFDPQQDIEGIVSRFSEAIPDEAALKVELYPELIRNFRGFNDAFVSYSSDELQQQKELLSRNTPFVAVQRQGDEIVMVNRVQMACRIAELALARL